MNSGSSAPNKHFCFVLIPSFSLVAFSCATDALRAANEFIGSKAYSWNAVSAGENITKSSSGFAIAAPDISEAGEPDVIVICGGDRSHEYRNQALTNWLQAKSHQNCAIGSISDGAFVLADIGLFSKVPSTIHWRCFDAYRERFPELDIRPSIMEISDNRFSCAGGTASLDLMLHFISADHGAETASRVADNYFLDIIRDTSKEQHLTNAYRVAGKNEHLAQALLLMENNLEAPLSIAGLSVAVGVSKRQLDRIFKRYVGSSPQAHYRELRLARASGLLIQTGMGITEIALACGFQSASHLGKFFKQRFAVTPGEFRRNAG